MRKLYIAIGIALLAGVAGGGWLIFSHSKSEPANLSAVDNTTSESQTQPVLDKTQYSLDEPDSIWVVVNKERPLPTDYQPTDLIVPKVKLSGSPLQELMHLRAPAAHALEDMYGQAKAAGLTLELFSGYRTAKYQKQLYDSYVATNGKSAADQFSARPGYSEHQTGLAADLVGANQKCIADECFANTKEGKWLAAHAYLYGFIIRYPKNKETVTGYEYEPWHLRYVGKDLAAQINDTGQTLEEFFDLPAAPDYPKD